jgi:thiol:disulfide interchange protein DsbD
MPPGEEKDDEFFGLLEVYHDQIEIQLPLKRGTGSVTDIVLTTTYQGCSEITGICYPPIKKSVPISLPAAKLPASVISTLSEEAAAAPALSEQDSLAQSLASGNTLATILLFFGLGLLLAFTPCVFPMIPILSSIIVGHGKALTTRKAFTLSLVYVLAMALTYTVAGVIAGMFGANLQAAFQNPWILGSFSALFVALALSMFGFYELQLPSSWQSRLSDVSNKQHGGSLTGVAIMGLLSALIVGPCVAPPLMGALIYIGQTGDALLGGLALFALSMGMGAPLLAIGTSAGKLLPRAGGWMDTVKAVFGVMLLAVAIWMMERILPAGVTMLLWALLAIVSAVYMGAIEGIREGASGWHKLWKGLGLVLLFYGIMLLVGVAAGNSDPLQPVKGLGGGTGASAESSHLTFRTIKSSADLDREIAAATAQGKSVMLDFYADWCVSCKEFEKYTFTDPAVQQALANSVTLQADVTANDETDQALMKRFRIIGPPAIIFYDQSGNELESFRVVGYMPAAEFSAHIRQAFLTTQ